ncbi:MAG TPA: hypothetical protein DCY20_10345, partial [Firmicutes bacterium]|nr:hypothetical protein [Bacillota bacterium]
LPKYFILYPLEREKTFSDLYSSPPDETQGLHYPHPPRAVMEKLLNSEGPPPLLFSPPNKKAPFPQGAFFMLCINKGAPRGAPLFI